MRKRALAFMVAAMALATVVGTSAAHAGTGAQPMGKFKLPFKGSTSSSGDAFQATNTGTGNSIEGDGASGYGTIGWTTSGFAGIGGFTNGANNGVYGEVNNSTGSGVYGHNKSSGDGVAGISEQGYGLSGHSNGGFAGVYGASPTNGVYGDVNNAGASGVYGHNAGTGNGVAGISDHGAGGYFKGGGGSNPAIWLDSGGIRVAGAGVDTPTPVFVHQVTNSNTCIGKTYTVLDNPFANNNPNAMIFVQALGTSANYFSVVYNVGGDCPSGRWVVSQLGGGSWFLGEAFNVWVIDP